MRIFHMLPVIGILAGCAGGGLSSFLPGLDERVQKAPMSEDSRKQLQAYFNKPNPKAFAFSPETGKNWHAWGAASVEEAEAISMSKCEEDTGTRCILFARNNDIVWTDPNAAPAAAATAAPAQGYVVRSTVNLRSGPSTSTAVVAVLQPGERLESLGQDGAWRMVRRQDGEIGFVHGDYIDPDRPTAPPPPAERPALDREALQSLTHAAEAGDSAKQYDLGNRYLHGFGVERDVVEARTWLAKAAAAGHPVAAYELGLIYEKGEGVAVDRAEALRWYQVAAAAGHQPSKDRARQLQSN